jgi:hypothetical protein
MMDNKKTKTIFLSHHIITIVCILLFIFRPEGTLSIGSPGLCFHPLLGILGEIPNPILNLRRIILITHGKKSLVYGDVTDFAAAMFFCFRIVAFPILFVIFFPVFIVYEPTWMLIVIYVMTSGFYIVSLKWFKMLLYSRTNRASHDDNHMIRIDPDEEESRELLKPSLDDS